MNLLQLFIDSLTRWLGIGIDTMQETASSEVDPRVVDAIRKVNDARAARERQPLYVHGRKVQAFFAQRPRPWRSGGNMPK